MRIIGEGPFQLEIDGWLRTVTANFTVQDAKYSGYVFDSTFDYTICRQPEERIGSSLYLEMKDGTCVKVKQNPLINLDGFESNVNHIFDLPDDSLQPIDQWWTDGDKVIYRLDISLFKNACQSVLHRRVVFTAFP